MTRWSAVLDRYEARLDAVGDALAAGDASVVPPFEPPSDHGRIPDELVGRATALLHRSRELEQRIDRARAAVRARLEAPTTTPRAPVQASRFDSSV